MTLEAHVLRPDAVRTVPAGYEVDVHLAWYRSLPLSCVEDIAITVAGNAPAREELRVRVDGAELFLAELPDLVDDWWFVQDPLSVVVPDEEVVHVGAAAVVEVMTVVRIPSIVIGPGTALVQRTRVTRRVVVR